MDAHPSVIPLYLGKCVQLSLHSGDISIHKFIQPWTEKYLEKDIYTEHV